MTWRIRAFSSALDAQNWLDELEGQGWSINDVHISASEGKVLVIVALYSPSYNASVQMGSLAVDKRWGNVE